MATVQASAERIVAASSEAVHALLSDYRDGRPRILPDSFRDYRVEEGGVGAGTVVTYTLAASGRERAYRMAVSEPEPGRVLHEDDTTSSFVQAWTIEPAGSGTRVRIHCSWTGSGGIGGFFERTFAPRGVGRVYEQLLDGLERELAAA